MGDCPILVSHQRFRSISPDDTTDSLELVTQYLPGWAFDHKDLFLGHKQISLLIVIELLTIPTPTTALHFATLASACYSTQRCLTGSIPLAESSSLSLRTNYSPQVALHLSSLKRS